MGTIHSQNMRYTGTKTLVNLYYIPIVTADYCLHIIVKCIRVSGDKMFFLHIMDPLVLELFFLDCIYFSTHLLFFPPILAKHSIEL